MDFNQLIQGASLSEINLVFKHCSRLRDFLGEKQAYDLLDRLLRGQELEILQIISDEEIIENYIQPLKKVKTDQDSTLSPHQPKSNTSQKQQPSSRQPPKTESLKKVEEKPPKTESLKRVEEKPPKTESLKKVEEKPSKTEALKKVEEKPLSKDSQSKSNQESKPKQKEETQQNRLKREVQEIFKEYQHLINSRAPHLTQLISLAFLYKQNTPAVLKKNLIQNKAYLLRGRRPDRSNIFQYLQLVDSALYHSSSGHRLRETQIFALLLFLISGSNRILLEILTGEGKSATISCLAAILTISGKAVDIVTTSQLLAQRDVKEQTKIYTLMGLEAAHNFQQNQRDEKECYTKNKIVYGTPHTFQVDILLNDYKKRRTRCDRPFQVLIVDEVDSMFIDQKQHQTLLSTTYPGFSELVYPMKIIWNKINMNPVFKQEGKFKIALAMGKNQTITGEAKTIMEEIVKDIRKNFDNEIIPEWRMEFVNESLEKWIQSAISAAFVLIEKTSYIVKNNKIVPIDYKNNGSLQENLHWNNGLHQFLEIKHGLPVTTEGMTSNFISNLGHFDKYQELYGLTGTLGSEKSKQFLKETYQTELFKVPPFKERRLQIQPGKVLYNQTDWANHICQSISNMLLCDRSVLILCQSIHEVDKLILALEAKQIKRQRLQELKTGEEKIDDKIDCGEIVIATNLAGRGADLKIGETLNQRGGLHVIISFMPINSRVEMQGRGRAGRNGYSGSSELAINYTKHCAEIGLSQHPRIIFQNTRQSDPSFFCEIRDDLQIQRMKQDDENVKQLRAKDRIFQIYCDGMNEIPDFQDNTAKQKALEEQWAMFLKKAENGQIPFEYLQEEAKILVDKLKANSDSYYTPNYEVERGINQLCEGRRDAAINFFQKAQNNNSGSLPQIIGGIYGSCCKINANKENKQNIASCLKELRNTQKLIENRKQMKKGFRINDLQNANVTNFHAQQLEKDTRSFEQKIRNSQNQFQVVSQLNNVDSLQTKDELKQNILKMSTGQDRILDGLSKNIDDLISTFQNLGKNQYVEVDFEPISKVLQSIEGDEKENKDALQRYKPEGLHFLPTGVIKKKQVSWQKRAGVFLLGVAQIVVGAIITASTAGALTGFGVNMMIEGAKCCFDSIFRPEQLNDLMKYFSQISMNYAFALATSGLEGIKQLGRMSSNGIKMFKNMPIGTFLEQTLKSTEKGLGIAMGGLFGNSISLQQKGKNIISRGLAHIFNHEISKQNHLRGMIEDPIQRIANNKENIRGKINQIQKQQERVDRSVEQIASQFTNKITKQIRKLISSLDKSLVLQLRNLPLDPQYINIIIKETLQEGLKLPEGVSPEVKELLKIFAEEIKKKNISQHIVQAFTNVIKLQKNIQTCLKSIGKHKKYDQIVKLGLIALIKNSFQKVTKTKKDSLATEKGRVQQKYEYLNTNRQTLTASTYNKEVQNYNTMETQFNEKVQEYNKFAIEEINFNDLVNTLDKNKGIVYGRIQTRTINSLPLHEYSKEALRNLQYSDSSKSFEQSLEAAIFNIVGNYGLKMINTIFENTNGKIDRLDQISKMLRSDA